MSLVTVDISEQAELALHRLSARKGKDVSATLVDLIEEAERFDDFEPIEADDAEERQEAAQGIQNGLDAYASGRHRAFDTFASEMRNKYLAGAASR